MGYSRDTFYFYKSAVADGGVEALFERTRSKPNLANRVDAATEQVVIKSATDFPAYGQARTSNELRKLGVFGEELCVKSDRNLGGACFVLNWCSDPRVVLIASQDDEAKWNLTDSVVTLGRGTGYL